MNKNRKLLKSWGENTAYSAKCHFKMYDINRYYMYFLVVINVLFAIFSLLEFNDLLIKSFSILSLVASVLILVHESQRNRNIPISHKQAGELYLSIHYDIETKFHLEKIDITSEDLVALKERIKEINQMNRPPINFLAKRWAKNSIEKHGEMHTWWK